MGSVPIFRVPVFRPNESRASPLLHPEHFLGDAGSNGLCFAPPVAAAEHRSPGRKGPDEVRAKPGMASQSAGPGTARRVARPGREAQGTPDRCLIRGCGAGRPFFSSLFFGRAKKRDPPVRGGTQRFGGAGNHRESAAPRFSPGKPGQTPFLNGVCPGFAGFAGFAVSAGAGTPANRPSDPRPAGHSGNVRPTRTAKGSGQ